jgi:hypothetical protein
MIDNNTQRLLELTERFFEAISLCCDWDTGFTESAGVDELCKALIGLELIEGQGCNLQGLRNAGLDLRRLVIEIRAQRLGLPIVSWKHR